MEINLEKLDSLVENAGKIFFSPEGEDILIQLLKIQDQVEEAVKRAKDIVEIRMLELDPNSTGIKGDKIKVYYRAYGTKYAIDEQYLEELPEDIYKKDVKYRPITKEVEAYIASRPDGMPRGIIERERKKSISFKRKEKLLHEE